MPGIFIPPCYHASHLNSGVGLGQDSQPQTTKHCIKDHICVADKVQNSYMRGQVFSTRLSLPSTIKSHVTEKYTNFKDTNDMSITLYVLHHLSINMKI